MAKKLNYQEMIAIAENILNPAASGLSEDELGEQLYSLCLNCPDPVGAMNWIVTEAMPPQTAKSLVDRALAQPRRDPKTLSESELPLNHPFRFEIVES
jgi:hypothetical protein